VVTSLLLRVMEGPFADDRTSVFPPSCRCGWCKTNHQDQWGSGAHPGRVTLDLEIDRWILIYGLVTGIKREIGFIRFIYKYIWFSDRHKKEIVL
jgi:hypothetical protein